MQLKQTTHRGFVLLEALFALALLGFGVLAVLQMAHRGLHTQRQQLVREAAMGLAQDLAQRMQLNATQLSGYAQSWQHRAVASALSCQQTACSASQLALWDVQRWRARVATELPQGDAAVFRTDLGGWGIVLAWQDEEESLRTDLAHGTPACPVKSSCWRLWVQP